MGRYYPECRVNISAVFEGFGGRDRPQVIEDIIPLTVSVNLNSYKEADTWEITFDAQRFPFSPELIRSAAVEIYMYQREDLTQEPFYVDIPQPTFSVTGIIDFAVNATLADRDHREKLMVTGLVDNIVLTQDDQGGVVSMSGRDYTSLLIDKAWNPLESGKRGRIPDGPLDEVVQKLVDEAVHADEIGRTLEVAFIDYEIVPNTGGVSKTVTQKKVSIKSPPTSKSRSKKKSRGIAVKSDSNYWDVIYKLCMSYGFICFVQGFNVYIAKPHVLYSDQEALWGHWRVAYGRNLESLSVERKLSKEAVPQIRVRSWDPKTKTAIEGKFPKDKENVKVTGVGTKKEEYRVYTVPDVTDENTLKEIARSTYFTLARGEGTIKFTTPALKDLDNKDLLRIRAGDAVYIEWDAFDSKLMTNSKLGTDQKIAALLAQGYKIDVARLVAEQYDKLDYFRQNFYVRSAKYDWNQDTGISLEVEAINFVNAQSDGKTDLT
jgi:hypothetical protein